MRFIADMWWLWIVLMIGSPIYGVIIYRRADKRGRKQSTKSFWINFSAVVIVFLFSLLFIVLSMLLSFIDFIKA